MSINDGRTVGESLATYADLSKESFPNLVDFTRTIMKYVNQVQQVKDTLVTKLAKFFFGKKCDFQKNLN